MAYFIFTKDCDEVENTIYKIFENQLDFDNSNLDKNVYKIIDVSQVDFNNVKYGVKWPLKYNNITITYVDLVINFFNKESLKNYIDFYKNRIKEFSNNNPNHLLFNRWINYYNQLNSLNLDNLTYPFNKSLEQYFNDLGQPSYNILQLP